MITEKSIDFVSALLSILFFLDFIFDHRDSFSSLNVYWMGKEFFGQNLTVQKVLNKAQIEKHQSPLKFGTNGV